MKRCVSYCDNHERQANRKYGVKADRRNERRRDNVSTAFCEAPAAGIATRINELHAAHLRAARKMGEYAIECGRLLIEARASIPQGSWLEWLKANCPDIRKSQAYNYMKVARENPNFQRGGNFSIRGLMKTMSEDDADESRHGVAKRGRTQRTLWGRLTIFEVAEAYNLRPPTLFDVVEADLAMAVEHWQNLLAATEGYRSLTPSQKRILAEGDEADPRLQSLRLDELWYALEEPDGERSHLGIKRDEVLEVIKNGMPAEPSMSNRKYVEGIAAKLPAEAAPSEPICYGERESLLVLADSLQAEADRLRSLKSDRDRQERQCEIGAK